jgi:acetyl esterase/lipase
VEANAALFQVLDDSPFLDGERVGLLGGGLGAALVWNSILGPLSGKARAAAVMQGVGSLEAVIRGHLFGKHCLRAYGLPADLDDETAIAELAPHDPLRQFQRLSPGMPLPRTAIYHGLVDVDLRPEPHATALTEAIRQAGGEVLLEVIPAVDHDLYALGREMEQRLAEFFGSSM